MARASLDSHCATCVSDRAMYLGQCHVQENYQNMDVEHRGHGMVCQCSRQRVHVSLGGACGQKKQPTARQGKDVVPVTVVQARRQQLEEGSGQGQQAGRDGIRTSKGRRRKACFKERQADCRSFLGQQADRAEASHQGQGAQCLSTCMAKMASEQRR